MFAAWSRLDPRGVPTAAWAPAPALYSRDRARRRAAVVDATEGFEFRFGGFAHGVGGAELGAYDLNGEFVTPRLPFFGDSWWSVFMPRANVGGLLTSKAAPAPSTPARCGPFRCRGISSPKRFSMPTCITGYLNNPPPGHSGLGMQLYVSRWRIAADTRFAALERR